MKQIFYLFLALLFSHGVFAQTKTWTGAADTDWNTDGNWSPSGVPGAANDVLIPGSLLNYPVLATTTSIQTLTIEAGASLTVNASNTLTIAGNGATGLVSLGSIHNNGTITMTATSGALELSGNAQFNNNTGATLTVITTGNYGIRLGDSGVLLNQTGATINSTGNSGSMVLSGNNTPVEMVKNYGRMNLTKQIEKYSDTFHNYPCGVVILNSDEVYNIDGQIINEGFFSVTGVPGNLNGTAANFINDGIVYVSGSASYTNNKIRIFNNAASTGIFEFGTSNDLTVAGIYKDDAATLLAGDYNQATNTFTHFGLSAGSQTLYAKITRPGGTCPQIVPFTFVVSVASDFTTHPTNQTVCPGIPAIFTVAIANATNYQWQINTGSGWNNVPATSPYSNVTTATLNISNVDGLNGYQYRCVATGAGGASVTSDAATLTIGAGGGSNPTGTLMWTGAVDTDWNAPCNWSPSSVPTATNDVVIPNTTNKPIIGIAAVAQSVEVQAGAALTINTTKSLTINGSKFIDRFTSGLFNAGTIHNNGQLILGNVSSVGELGLLNTGTFNNNTGAEITIDRATDGGLLNYPGGIFTNAAKITLGATASVGFTGLSNFATFNNNSGGEIIINRSSNDGLYNNIGGTFTNAAKISIGTLTSYMAKGLTNFAAFFNNAGGEITIDNTDAYGILSTKNNPSSPVATFTNAGKITIGAIALQSIGLTNGDGSTFNNNTGGEIKIDRSTNSGLQNGVGGTFNNAAAITIGANASVGLYGLKNEATFNNTGGEIKIDNSTDRGLWNQAGTFTNAAKITIGATASVGTDGLKNEATFNNNTGAEITIDRATDGGLFNYTGGIFTNVAKITIGANASVGQTGLNNRAIFNNNTGGEITVNRSTTIGLNNNEGAAFTNAAKILIGTMTPTMNIGLFNYGAFINNAGGEITIDNTTSIGLISKRSELSSPVATFTNAGKITIGAIALQSIGLVNTDGSTFNNNAGGEIKIDRSTNSGLRNEIGGTFTNAAHITIGATASVGLYGLKNEATFNNTGGEIKIDNSTDRGLWNQAGTFTNAAKITIGATASVGIFGLLNDATVNNTACGKLIVASGTVETNASRTITNAGLVQIAGTLNNNGTFTNNGVLKYGSLTGSVTNNTDPSLIVNDTPTPIFTYGTAMYDGVINGIFTTINALPGESAGTFTAPNTFVPSGSLPSTLYAKITPSSGGCFYVIPFSYESCAPTISSTANLLDNSTPGQCGKIIFYNSITTGTPTVTYTFSGATIASGSGTGSGSFFNVGETTVTLTATNSCGTANYSFTVTILGTTTLTLGTIPAILAGATTFTIPYTATTGSPTTYSISGPGFTTVTDAALTSSPITVNLSAPASVSFDFTLTVKNASGCTSANSTGSVIVNTPLTQDCATATFTGIAPIAPTATTAGVGGRGGIHTYTVPAGVTAIRIDAKGAKGGSTTFAGGSFPGGKGGRVQGTFAVTPGDVLHILVAGKGGDANSIAGGENPGQQRTAAGGGGATIVSNGPIGSGTLLLVGAGGGGAGRLAGGGIATQSGGSGAGGAGNIGAGGASVTANGANSSTGDLDELNCGEGGKAATNGGNGGAAACSNRLGTNGGGYGGGGAGNYSTPNGNAGGGGGAGYTGGGGGGAAGGNAGTNYVNPSATNTQPLGVNEDDNGSVVIYAVAGTHQMTWTGAVNTDWNTPCNWSPGGIPTATNDVVIPNTTNKPIIGTAAVAQTVEVQAGATLTIAATKSLTVNGSKIIGFLLTGFHNAGTVQNNGTLTLGNTGSVGDYGIVNNATFNNNTGGEIRIDRSTLYGLLNEAGGTFTNVAKITIGAMASVGSNGLENKSTFNNNAGEIKIDRSTQVGLSNKFNFTNAAKITIGATAGVGNQGLLNEAGTFNNTTGGDITINGATEKGLIITDGGTVTNVAKITVNGAIYGITNFNGSFQNNTNGEIKVDNSLTTGILNEQGTFTNLAKISINVLHNITEGLVNNAIFNNSAAGILEIDGASGTYLDNQRGTFTNAAQIKLGSLSATEALNGIVNEALFNNNLGGEITITNAEDGFINLETLTNNALITITASGRAETVGFRNGNLVTNNACGKIIVLKGMLLNRPGDTFTNIGLVQVTDNLTNEGIFTNNGVLKYGTLTGTITNNTNPSLIVNDTPTPIFTYGGTYDGVINGIYTDANATVSAGAFSAPNTFTPSGLPLGSQTLYAKITPSGSGCTYVVPFTYINAACNLTDFALSGGGISFCQSPLSIATAGSQIGANYQLKRNNVNLGNPIEGTGNPLTFPGLTQAGTYTILATGTVGDCSRTLSGEITIQTRNAPIAYNLSGGGASCSGTPVGINLSNSQIGVLYQLKRGTTPVGSPVPGTGNAISFPPQNTAGNYTAVALTQCADLTMNNTVSITSVVTPNTFTVTGGGTSCGTPLPVGLSGSQSGVFYQLYRNGSPVGTTVQGTGQAITLGNHLTQGTYTIVATRAGECPTLMTGSVSILLIDPPALFNVIGGGVACPGGVSIGLSGSQSGIQYQLKRGTTLVSTWEGDGTPFSFGNQTVAGTYTVEAISQGSCTRTMSGNALVTAGGTLPNVYSMTGGGAYCNNVAVALGLSDSQAKVFYQLQRNTPSGFVNVGTSVQGTGKALSLGTHSILGEYRVVVNSACMTIMSGSKSITACNARIAADAQLIGITKEAFAQVMPNPVVNTLHLKVNEAKGQKVNISLVDASGRTLLQRAFVPPTNQHQEELEVSDLANGMYFLRVDSIEKHATLKVIKVQ